MVSAYGTMANGGRYLAPVLVTRIENRQGEVLAEFGPAVAEVVLSPQANHSLLQALRGVVDKGTGSAIRIRFGIRADVAGKTGTTQDNADGWFILMHPQLVSGAWVGFNDGRVTLRSDYWGQGAHSALPMVGNFTAQALRTRVIDSRVKFEAPPAGFFSQLRDRLSGWLQRLLAPEPPNASPPVAPPVKPVDTRPALPVELVPPAELIVNPPAEPTTAPLDVPAQPMPLPAAPTTPVRPMTPATPAGPLDPTGNLAQKSVAIKLS
jgi:penicillin-binding protein 1A